MADLVDTTPAPAPPPVQVYDAHYARVVNAPADAVAADPKRFAPVGAQMVRMIGPDGATYELPASSAQGAVDAGWQWLGDAAAAREGAVQYHQAREYGSGVRVGINHAANQLLMGVPDVVDEHTLTPEQIEAKARGDAAHPVAANIGGAAGLIGGAIATGGVGELVGGAAERGATSLVSRAGAQAGATAGAQAVAPGLLSRAAGYAARGAADGALYAAPQATAQAAYGDVDQAAESMLWGIGTGGLVGLGAGGFREAANAVGNKLQGALRDTAIAHGVLDEAGQVVPGKLGELATTQRAGLLGLTGEGAEKLAGGDVDALEKFVKSNGLTGASAEKLGAAREAAQQALDAHAGAIDSAIAKAPADVAAGVGVVPTDLATKVQEQVMATRPGLSLPREAVERAGLDKLTSAIAEYGSKPTSFATTQAIRDALPSLAGKAEGSLTTSEKIAKQVYDIVSTEQQKSMGEALNKLGLTSDYGSFLGAQQRVQNLNQLASLAPSGLVPGGALAPVVAGAGALAGQAVRGAAGSLGGMVGYQIGKGVAGRIADHAASGALDMATGVLRKMGDSPASYAWLGPALGKGAVDAATSRIAGAVTSLGARAGAVVADPVKSYLGAAANGLSKDQQYDRVASTLTQAGADPSRVQAEAQTMGHVIAGSDPGLAAAVAQKQQATIGYLASAVPKDPNPPAAFGGASAWTPALADKRAFLDKLEIAQNPAAALAHAQAGTLTQAHVDALTQLYPSTKAQLVGEIAKVAYGPKAPKLSEGQKHGLAMLTGVPLNNPKQVNYQTAYQQAQSSQGPSPGPKASGHPKMTHLPSMATGVQATEQRAGRM